MNTFYNFEDRNYETLEEVKKGSKKLYKQKISRDTHRKIFWWIWKWLWQIKSRR